MIKATKKQMVDFINARCRVGGKKIPKYKLQQCPEKVLLDTINSSERAIKEFERYVIEDNEAKVIAAEMKKTKAKQSKDEKSMQKDNKDSVEESREKVCELEELVDNLIAAPTSFWAIMQFKEFMEKLSYGEVSDKTLKMLIDKLQIVNPAMAMTILEYSVEQTLHFEE